MSIGRVYKSLEKSAGLCLHDAALIYPLGWPVGLGLCSTILTAVLKCLNLENLNNFQFSARGMVGESITTSFHFHSPGDGYSGGFQTMGV